MASKSATKVIVGSKLPTALILKHPYQLGESVMILGLNSSRIAGASYMTTEVDSDFWDAWYLVHNHKDHPFAPLATGAIFVANNQEAAKAIAKERSKQRTGLEPMAQKADERMKEDALKVVPASGE